MKRTTLFVGLIVIVIILLVGGRFYFSDSDFGIDNPFWNGMDDLSSGLNAHPLYDISSLATIDSHDTLLIVSPQTNYTPEESDMVLKFLNRGGKVVVMDDFGNADSLLSGISSPILINPTLLCQYDDYYVNQSFPIIKNFSTSAYFLNVSQLTLNYPAALNVSGANVLATSSNKAWLDYNDNVKMDPNERVGTYPVIASADYNGMGELIVVSDPDIFINSMLDKSDNRVFMSNLLTGVVWVDVSHGRGIAALDAFYFVLRDDLLAQLLFIAFILACALAYMNRKAIALYMKKFLTNGWMSNIQKSIIGFMDAKIPLRGKILKK